MSFRLVPKSVTLNDLERRNGRYTALFYSFTEFGKPVFQPRRSVHGRIYARVLLYFVVGV